MIYETVDPLEPIRQGDIFKHVPRVDMKLSELPPSSERFVIHPDGKSEWVPTESPVTDGEAG